MEVYVILEVEMEKASYFLVSSGFLIWVSFLDEGWMEEKGLMVVVGALALFGVVLIGVALPGESPKLVGNSLRKSVL